MKCVLIQNNTGKPVTVKESGNDMETVLPSRSQLQNVDVSNFDELKSTGVFMRVQTNAVKESTDKRYLKG